MFTPSQVSETLGIPASTIRRWANKFSPYLSEQPGKKRMYTISDLDIFRQIRTFSSQGLSLDQIADSLKVREPDQVKAVELLALDDFAQALAVTDQSAESSALITLADFAQSLQFARDQVAHLQTQLDQQTARLDALTAWLALPFYKRWFTKPPRL